MPGIRKSQSGASERLFVRKTNDETVNNSAVVQADDELFFALGANQVAYGFLIGQVAGNTVADLRIAFGAPAGAAISYSGVMQRAASDGLAELRGAITVVDGEMAGIGVDSASRLMVITFWVANGANAGNVTFKWAQSTATVGNTTVQSGSRIIGWRVNG